MTGVSAGSDIAYHRLDLRVADVDLSVAAALRAGELAPIVFLQGFGSTTEDYVDLAIWERIARFHGGVTE